jgi:aspartate aminotransferase-like enzyme
MDKNKYAYLDGSLKIIEWDKKFLLIENGSFSYRWYDNVKRY